MEDDDDQEIEEVDDDDQEIGIEDVDVTTRNDAMDCVNHVVDGLTRHKYTSILDFVMDPNYFLSKWTQNDRYRRIFTSQYIDWLLRDIDIVNTEEKRITREYRKYVKAFNNMPLVKRAKTPLAVSAMTLLFPYVYQVGLTQLPVIEWNDAVDYYNTLYKIYREKRETELLNRARQVMGQTRFPRDLVDMVMEYDMNRRPLTDEYQQQREYMSQLPMGDNLFGMRRPRKRSSSSRIRSPSGSRRRSSSSRYHRRRSTNSRRRSRSR